jgi:hypothetical protein
LVPYIDPLHELGNQIPGADAGAPSPLLPPSSTPPKHHLDANTQTSTPGIGHTDRRPLTCYQTPLLAISSVYLPFPPYTCHFFRTLAISSPACHFLRTLSSHTCRGSTGRASGPPTPAKFALAPAVLYRRCLCEALPISQLRSTSIFCSALVHHIIRHYCSRTSPYTHTHTYMHTHTHTQGHKQQAHKYITTQVCKLLSTSKYTGVTSSSPPSRAHAGADASQNAIEMAVVVPNNDGFSSFRFIFYTVCCHMMLQPGVHHFFTSR